jgi:ribosomal protein S18 acetylase RimI-like enzyme
MMQLRSFDRHDPDRNSHRDLDALYLLDQVCFPPEIAYSRAELHHFLMHPKCSCWIAEQAGDSVAGFVILERSTRRGRSTGHIVTLDVAPGNRRTGVGTLLMQTVEREMRGEGFAVISLEVAANNAAARHFYDNLGFVAIGRIANYYGGRVDAEVMEKPLLSHGYESHAL